MVSISCGTPGREMITLPPSPREAPCKGVLGRGAGGEGVSTMNDGALPTGFSMAMAPRGSMACRFWFSPGTRP